MRHRCTEENCEAPKSLCSLLLSTDYQGCPHWNETLTSKGEPKKDKNNADGILIPWSGMQLTPSTIEVISHRNSPLIIGIVGAANAGKTSFLGMLYTLLFNGRKFNKWRFAGSFTLIGWEAQAKGLKIGINGKVPFPEATPSTSDYYSFYHLALKKDNVLFDALFADSSGEVFTKWAADTEDPAAENAKWIYDNSDAFIFFIDCEDLITRKGRARLTISLMAGQVAANLNDRPVIVVWSKSDRLTDISGTIKSAVERTIADSFPESQHLHISNFSKSVSDKLCFVNNLAAVELVLESLTGSKEFILSPSLQQSTDFFINYKGRDGIK